MSYEITATKKTPNTARVGDMIKKHRLELGMTREELANVAGCSISTIQAYEVGNRKYPLSSINKIGKSLKIPLKSFLEASVNRVLRDNGIDYVAVLHEKDVN